MKKIFTGYRESEVSLWLEVAEWVHEQIELAEDKYMNDQKVVIIEVHEDQS